MGANLIAILYLVAGILFVLALRSSLRRETVRRGMVCGIAGLAVAVLATFGLAAPSAGSSWLLLIGGIAIGGVVGATIARRIRMSGVPYLVAALQSLTGLAVVMVAAAVLQAPDAFGFGEAGDVATGRLVEMAIGAVLGAFVFAGFAIAFLRRGGFIEPYRLPAHIPVLIALVALTIVLGIVFVVSERQALFWLVAALALLVGVLVVLPIGRDDMPVAQFVLNGCCGLAIAAIGFLLGTLILIIAGALIGASAFALAVRTCRNENRSIRSVLFGGGEAL